MTLEGTRPVPLGREFRLFAAGQAVSAVGDRVAVIALVFLVIHETKSYAPALGLFYVCKVLPTLFAGLIVGVVVDHWNRRNAMIFCDLGRTLLLLVVPFLTTASIWTVYPVVLVLYSLTLVFDTAARAAIPDVVPDSHMMRANAVLQSIDTAADFAYAAGGVLVVVLKFQAPFFIDAATFLFSTTMIAAMQLPDRGAGPLPSLSAAFTSIQDGIRYVFGNPFLKWTSVTFAVAPMAGGAIFVLTPLYASQVLVHGAGIFGPLRNGAFLFSLLEVGVGVGALVGSMSAARLGSMWPRGRIFGIGIAGLGVTTALLSTTTNIYVALALMAASGIFNSLFVVSGMTLTQVLAPSDMRGRVVSFRFSLINGSLALGSAVGGAMLLFVSYQAAWLALGGIILVSSLCVWVPREVRTQH